MTAKSSDEDLEMPPAEEETPLLKRSGFHQRALIPEANQKIVTTKGVEIIHTGTQVNYVDKKRDIDKIIAFDPEGVLGWSALLKIRGTVFQMGMVLEILAANVVLGIFVAGLVAEFPSINQDNDNTELLDSLIQFLMKFLAFMTGFFVNSAFSRWQEILKQFFLIFQALKKIYTSMALHGVPRPALEDVRRWGILSMAVAALEAPGQWDPPQWDEEFADLSSEGLLNEEEKKALTTKIDCNKATLIWVWIVMKVQECSKQGYVPPRTTPALVKIVDHCHEATTAINRIQELIIFQVPHQYMHMLAFLIHLFNIINTVRCGLEIGSAYHIMRTDSQPRPTAMQVQNIVTYICIMMLSPLIYQAFLCISLDITIPFGNGSTDVPVKFLLDRFQQDLDDMDACLKDPAPGSALPASRPGTYTGSKFPPSAGTVRSCGVS